MEKPPRCPQVIGLALHRQTAKRYGSTSEMAISRRAFVASLSTDLRIVREPRRIRLPSGTPRSPDVMEKPGAGRSS